VGDVVVGVLALHEPVRDPLMVRRGQAQFGEDLRALDYVDGRLAEEGVERVLGRTKADTHG
jgi:hypothetical protein